MDENAEIASRLTVAVIASRKKPVTPKEAAKIYNEIKAALGAEFIGAMPEAGYAR